MSMEAFGDIGIGVVAAVLILREVFSYLKSRDKLSALDTGDGECEDAAAKLASIEDKMNSLATSTASMVSVMEKCDAAGLPLVYRDGSLTQAIQTLGTSIERLSSKVERL